MNDGKKAKLGHEYNLESVVPNSMFLKELASEDEQRSVTHLKCYDFPVKSTFSDVRSKRAAIQIPGRNSGEYHLKLLSEVVMTSSHKGSLCTTCKVQGGGP